MQQRGRLSLFDLSSSSIVDMSGLGVVYGAAFAPGSDVMAVQADRRVLVVDLTGRVQREIPRPREDLGVLPDVAWSPDGRWIALVPYDFTAYGGTATGGPNSVSYGRPGSAVTLVAAAGTGSSRGPFDLDHHFVLGWRDADTLVRFDGWTYALSTLSVSDGHNEPLATITAGNVCDIPIADCHLNYLSTATGLLRAARIESADWPVRGRLVAEFQLVGLVLLVSALVAVARRVTRVVARRRTSSAARQAG